MLAVFAAIFLVMGVMIYFITLSLRIVTENASKKVNAYFLSKLQEYDDDFEEKLDELAQLQEEKEKLQQEIRILKMDHSMMQPSRFYKPRPVIRDSFIPIARYIDNGFFEDYKLAKTLLVMDKEDIIRTIMEKFPYGGNMDRYKSAQNILDKLNFEAIYDLCSISEENQLKVLGEELNDDEEGLFEEYAKEINLDAVEDFKILDFRRVILSHTYQIALKSMLNCLLTILQAIRIKQYSSVFINQIHIPANFTDSARQTACHRFHHRNV